MHSGFRALQLTLKDKIKGGVEEVNDTCHGPWLADHHEPWLADSHEPWCTSWARSLFSQNFLNSMLHNPNLFHPNSARFWGTFRIWPINSIETLWKRIEATLYKNIDQTITFMRILSSLFLFCSLIHVMLLLFWLPLFYFNSFEWIILNYHGITFLHKFSNT